MMKAIALILVSLFSLSAMAGGQTVECQTADGKRALKYAGDDQFVKIEEGKVQVLKVSEEAKLVESSESYGIFRYPLQNGLIEVFWVIPGGEIVNPEVKSYVVEMVEKTANGETLTEYVNCHWQ